MILERVGEEEEGGEMEGEGEGVNNMEGAEGRGRAREGAGDREKLHSIIIFFYHTRGHVAFRQPSVFVWWLALRALYTTLQRCNAVQGFCRRRRRHGRRHRHTGWASQVRSRVSVGATAWKKPLPHSALHPHEVSNVCLCKKETRANVCTVSEAVRVNVCTVSEAVWVNVCSVRGSVNECE